MSSTTLSSLNIDKTKPVLVTGATGYVAGVLVSQLLDLGLTVHATVRDPSKKDKLTYLTDLANKAPGTIKFFKGDLLDEGSYDDGMKGCNVVFHTASPFVLNPKDPVRDLIDPAVKGTKNVLASASRTASVKRVVLTSSVVSIYTDASETYINPGNVLNEEIWNTTATYEYQPYCLSKVRAEQAAWVVAGSQTQWSLVVVNPGFVLGPGIKFHPTSESFEFMQNLGGGTMKSGCPNYAIAFVDVRDVALGHILAAYNPTASGRNILVSTNTGMMDMANVLKKKYADYPIPSSKVYKTLIWLLAPYLGVSGLTRRGVSNNVDITINLDNTKSIQQLGMSYRSMEETLHDMYQQFIDEGAINKDGSSSSSKNK